MKKTRLLSLLLILVLLVSLAGGCGAGSAAGASQSASASAVSSEASVAASSEVAPTPATPKGEIVFWTQDTAVWTGWFKPAIEEFQKNNPDIKVKVEYFPEFADKLTQAFAAGQQPDVAQTWQGITNWAKAGAIAPVPETYMTKADIEKTYFEGALKNKIFDGKYFGLPCEINVESPGLLVNMGILEKMGKKLPAGWVENDGPKTWDELDAFAKELTITDQGQITQSGLAYTYAQWEAMFLSLIWQYGGDYRDEAGKTVKFNTPEAHKAAEFLLKYCNGTDAISNKGVSRFDVFTQGLAAMCVGAPWYAGSMATDAPDIKYQYFNLPAFVAGSDPYCVANGGWGYIVSSTTKAPDAAWEFVRQMTTPENIGSWALACGTLGARQDTKIDLKYDPNVGSVEKALSISTKILPYGREDGAYTLDPSALVYTVVRQQLRNMLETGDIDTALKTMEKEGNELIQTNLNR